MLNSITLPVEVRGRIPHLDQYFGLWAMNAEQLVANWQLTSKLDLHMHLASPQAAAAKAAAKDSTLDVRDGIAIVTLRGTLMKQQSSLGSATSTIQARRQIRDAAADPSVNGILLVVESPGGTVAGTQELADDIRAATRSKPVWGFAEDLCCSAGYWAISQTQRIFANPTATVGSIGTYAAITDESARASAMGVKVHIVKAGEHKGAGHPGTPVTDEQLAMMQERVNQLNDLFVQSVATGRRLSLDKAREIADGRGHVAAQAKQLGLIDGVQSLDQTFSQFVAFTQRKKSMDATSTIVSTDLLPTAAAPATQQAAPVAPAAPRAATPAELKAACPGASADFVLAQLEAGATVAAAQTAFVAAQAKQLADLQQQLAAEKAKPAPVAAAPKKIGVDPTPPSGKGASSEDEGGDAIAAFEAAVADEMQASRCSKATATRNVSVKQPQLQQAYVAAFNARRR